MKPTIIVGSAGQDGSILFDRLRGEGRFVVGIDMGAVRCSQPSDLPPVDILDAGSGRTSGRDDFPRGGLLPCRVPPVGRRAGREHARAVREELRRPGFGAGKLPGGDPPKIAADAAVLRIVLPCFRRRRDRAPG